MFRRLSKFVKFLSSGSVQLLSKLEVFFSDANSEHPHPDPNVPLFLAKCMEYRDTYDIVPAIGENPLGLWSKYVSLEGRVRRIEDESLNGDRVIEIKGPENSRITTNICCPASPVDCLNIKLPILVIILKNLKAAMKIDFQVIDEEDIRRKFVLSTSETSGKGTMIDQEAAKVSLELEDDWNCLEIDLRSLCKSIYRSEYKALQRLIVHQSCRLRRIYLQDRHYEHDETPIQLCQAFFDMYMLKWGINFVEKSCQTSVTYFGAKADKKIPSEETTVARAARNGKSFTTEKATSAKKCLRPESIGSKRLKDDLVNLDIKIKKKSNILKEEPEKVFTAEDRIDSSIGKTASTPARIEKIGKNGDDAEGEIFRKWPYNYQQFHQADINTTAKLQENNPTVLSARKNLAGDRTKFSSILNSLNRQFPKLSGQSQPLEVPVPPEVEREAAAENEKTVETTRSKILTTDEAVRDYLELRHVINRKLLDKFRARGLTMIEVELSIYNSKNRQNSYGQGKLVEKHRTSLEKGCNVVNIDEKRKNRAKSAIK